MMFQCFTYIITFDHKRKREKERKRKKEGKKEPSTMLASKKMFCAP